MDRSQPEPHRSKVAIIINPTKFEAPQQTKTQITQQAKRCGWAEVIWYETTPDDGGTSQTKQALAEGATLVCSLGGDGTVRAVAESLVGTSIPLGILPGGTGNLLARNLGLPCDDFDDALWVAFTGIAKPIDVGVVRCSGGVESIFLVAAGLGLDAAIMANAGEKTKKYLGWIAYVLAAFTAVTARGFRVHVVGGDERTSTRHAQLVMVGNCGELRGGLTIMPAELTDGLLHTLVLAPRGVFGWISALADILTRHHRGHPRLQRSTSTTVKVTTAKPITAQLDGDVIGEVTSLECWIKPNGLLVQQDQNM